MKKLKLPEGHKRFHNPILEKMVNDLHFIFKEAGKRIEEEKKDQKFNRSGMNESRPIDWR